MKGRYNVSLSLSLWSLWSFLLPHVRVDSLLITISDNEITSPDYLPGGTNSLSELAEVEGVTEL